MSVPNHASGSPGFASAKCHHEPDRQDTWWRGTGCVNPRMNKQIPFFYHNMGGYLWLITFLGASDPIKRQGECVLIQGWYWHPSLSRTPLISGDLYRGEIFGRENWVTWWTLGQFGNSGLQHARNHPKQVQANQQPHVGADVFLFLEDPYLKWRSWSLHNHGVNLGEWLGECGIRVVVDLLPAGHMVSIFMSSSIKFQEPISDPDGFLHKLETPKSYDA